MSVFLQPIYTQTVGAGGAASVTFNNIPQTFTDLKIVCSTRSTGSAVDGVYLTPNTGGATSFSITAIYGNGTLGFGSYNSSNGPAGNFGAENGTGSTANSFASYEAYIANYTGSNFKSWIADSVAEDNSSGGQATIRAYAGLFRNTAAITSINITNDSGNSFAQYSKFSLYGVLRQGI
jgi:hypothetical protein